MKTLIYALLIIFNTAVAARPELIELGRLTAEEILLGLDALPHKCPYDKEQLARQGQAVVCGKAEMSAEKMMQSLEAATPPGNAWIEQDGAYVNAYDTLDGQGMAIVVKNWGEPLTRIYIFYPYFR